MHFESSDLTAGQLNALVKKVGGKLGAERILRGEFDVRCANMPTWKTLVLKAGQTRDGYRTSVIRAGCGRDYNADFMLFLEEHEFSCVQEDATIDLILISARELGFFDPPLYRHAFARGIEMGLKLCPPETGPALCIAYTEQVEGEKVMIATKPIGPTSSEVNNYNYFGVKTYEPHSGRNRWLIGDSYYGSCRSVKDLLVFAKT